MADNKIIYNAIRTPDGTVLRSRHRHDFNGHKDAVTGKVYLVDGGLDYLRRSSNGDEVELSITTDHPHDQARWLVDWGTRGPAGDQPLHYKIIADMDTDHIEAVLATQHVHPNLEVVLNRELAYRKQLV